MDSKKLVAGQQKKEAEEKLKNLTRSLVGGGVYVGAIISADQYDEEFVDVLLCAMRHGLDRKGAAGAIGVSWKTFQKWVADHPKFAEAAEVGDTLCQTFWQMKGINNLTYSPTGRQINSKIYQMFMQSNCGWGEQKEEAKKQMRVLAFELNEKPTHLNE